MSSATWAPQYLGHIQGTHDRSEAEHVAHGYIDGIICYDYHMYYFLSSLICKIHLCFFMRHSLIIFVLVHLKTISYCISPSYCNKYLIISNFCLLK